jgi:uncharacterized PurR-regulated membrane protein YhhQ (DUF165 family)
VGNRTSGALCFAGYIGTIFAANWALATFGLVPVGFGLLAPAGVYFAGLAFTLRDGVQHLLGKGATLLAILLGAGLSAFVSPQFAIASGTAFLFSELADFAVYTPLAKRRWLLAVGASNVVGFVVDSVLFLWLAFGSLQFLAGQLVGKAWMTALAVIVLLLIRRSAAARTAAKGGVMLYLSGVVKPMPRIHPQMGVIITPAHGNRVDLALEGQSWAADNGCYSQGDAFRLGRYIVWLEEKVAPWRASCLFATAPDVVGDHAATWKRSAPILPIIRALGYRAAFVAQNGIDPSALDWEAFDVLFLGGDTPWKLSQGTRHLVADAKAQGKWVHMGRVNSLKRLQRATLWNCDSADGTYVRFRPDRYIRDVGRWLDIVNGQRELIGA